MNITNNIGMSKFLVVQKKSTPFKKPKNNGGSPNGVKEPPIFATKNIKNTNICTFFFRHLFALINGRISNIDAPVVPIHEAIAVPINKNNVFNFGEPTREPFNLIPPEIVNNTSNNIINGIYSSSRTCKSSLKAISAPYENQNGRKNRVTQKADIFPKLYSQKWGLIKGSIAIDNKIPTNGKTEKMGKSPNSELLAKRLVIKIPVKVNIL